MKNLILLVLTLTPLLLVSCSNANKNDFDISNLKIPQKNKLKISERDNFDYSQTKTANLEEKFLPYKEKSEVLNSVKIGKKDPFAKESEVNKFSSNIKAVDGLILVTPATSSNR